MIVTAHKRNSGKIFIFLFVFVLGGTCDISAQDSTKLKQYFQLTKNLLQHKGKWLASNPAFKKGDPGSPNWISYEYSSGIHPYIIKLTVRGYIPKKAEWINQFELVFAWDDRKKNAQVTGTDSRGNFYIGESGKLTAAELSYDLLDPTIAAAPTYLRYNQTFYDSSMSIAHYKQEGNRWVFTETLDFKPIP